MKNKLYALTSQSQLQPEILEKHLAKNDGPSRNVNVDYTLRTKGKQQRKTKTTAATTKTTVNENKRR